MSLESFGGFGTTGCVRRNNVARHSVVAGGQLRSRCLAPSRIIRLTSSRSSSAFYELPIGGIPNLWASSCFSASTVVLPPAATCRSFSRFSRGAVGVAVGPRGLLVGQLGAGHALHGRRLLAGGRRREYAASSRSSASTA
jgi:hypothetical protein